MKTLLTEAETAALLGLTISGVVYLAESGRLTRVGNRRLYDLDQVTKLAEYRRTHPQKTGRPPAKPKLVARLAELVEA